MATLSESLNALARSVTQAANAPATGFIDLGAFRRGQREAVFDRFADLAAQRANVVDQLKTQAAVDEAQEAAQARVAQSFLNPLAEQRIAAVRSGASLPDFYAAALEQAPAQLEAAGLGPQARRLVMDRLRAEALQAGRDLLAAGDTPGGQQLFTLSGFPAPQAESEAMLASLPLTSQRALLRELQKTQAGGTGDPLSVLSEQERIASENNRRALVLSLAPQWGKLDEATKATYLRIFDENGWDTSALTGGAAVTPDSGDAGATPGGFDAFAAPAAGAQPQLGFGLDQLPGDLAPGTGTPGVSATLGRGPAPTQADLFKQLTRATGGPLNPLGAANMAAGFLGDQLLGLTPQDITELLKRLQQNATSAGSSLLRGLGAP